MKNNKKASTTASPNGRGKEPARRNESDSKVSFETRIIRFHYSIIVIFLTLLLVYDLGCIICEKFAAFFSYLGF